MSKINGAGKPGGHFLKIDDTLYQSIAFRTLPGSAAKLWLDVRTQYRGGNNGRLLVTPQALRARGWNSRQKLFAAARELIRRGLLRFTRRCGPNTFHKASLFAFTDLDVARADNLGIAGAKAGHEYLHWLPGKSFDPRDGGVDTASGTAFCVDPKRVTNGTRIGSETGPVSGQRTPETGPESGHRGKAPKAASSLDLRGVGGGTRTLS